MEDMEMRDKSFWANRKVFVTGHTGFKGTWLSVWLLELGAKVTGYSLDVPTNPSLFEEVGIKSFICDMRGDICNLSALKNAIKVTSPEIVIHLAAQPIVKESYLNPIGTLMTNAIGTANVLEAVRESEAVKAVLIITTDKVYENKEWLWGYRENEPLGGYDPYSASKACAEIITSSYRRSFFDRTNLGYRAVGIATARAGNVIGGGDWAKDRIIPDCVRSFNKGEKVKIRNPESIRPWQYVLEPLSGYLQLCEKLYSGSPEYADSWNFGPKDEDGKTVEWVVKKMNSLWPSAPGYIIDETKHAHEATYLKLDSSKARSIIGWQPKWHVSEAIAKVVDWNLRFNSGIPALSICRQQIAEYKLASTQTD